MAGAQRQESWPFNLEDIILTWTLEDIANEKAFKGKMRVIPAEFSSVPEYSSSFAAPFLEEIRSKLQRSLLQESLVSPGRPCFQISVDSLEEQASSTSATRGPSAFPLRNGVMGRLGFRLASAGASKPGFDSQWGSRNNNGRKKAGLKSTDIVVLTNFPPQPGSSLLACPAGGEFALGVLIKTPEDDGQAGDSSPGSTSPFGANVLFRLEGEQTRASVLIGETIRLRSEGATGEKPRMWWATAVDSICPSQRVWEAIMQLPTLGKQKGSSESEQPGRLIQALLSYRRCPAQNGPASTTNSSSGAQEVLEASSLHLASQSLNEYQHSAVMAALGGLMASTPTHGARSSGGGHADSRNSQTLQTLAHQLSHLSIGHSSVVPVDVPGRARFPVYPVQLIQGPPGTGKTKTLASLLSGAASLGCRTLACASTNVAVAEVASRLLKLVAASGCDAGGPHQRHEFPGTCCAALCRPLSHLLAKLHLRRSSSARGCVGLTLGDILVVGNEERMEVDGLLGQIFLGERSSDMQTSRTARLTSALSIGSGWKASCNKLVALLDMTPEEVQRKWEQWLEDNTQQAQQSGGRQGLWGFVVTQLRNVVESAESAGKCLLKDLPSSTLPAPEKQGVRTALKAMRDLCAFASGVILTDSEAYHFFQGNAPVTTSSVPHPSGSSTRYMKGLLVHREKVQGSLARQPAYKIAGMERSVGRGMVADLCIKGARVVLATTCSSGRKLVRLSGGFDLLVVDEAAQVVEAESLVSLLAPGLRFVVLVGDPKQLPATVFSQLSTSRGYNRSLFERLQGQGLQAQLLRVQYRMHPSISAFPCRQFYASALQDGPNVLSPLHCLPPHISAHFPGLGPFTFLHIQGREEKDESSSTRNPDEGLAVVSLLTRLSAATKGSHRGDDLSVGVISPYKAQQTWLTNRVRGMALPGLKLEVNSVDGFQGRECDVIILTTVRSNINGAIGFVKNKRRMNVALTRARLALWVVGDAGTLQRGCGDWRALLKETQSKGFSLKWHQLQKATKRVNAGKK